MSIEVPNVAWESTEWVLLIDGPLTEAGPSADGYVTLSLVNPETGQEITTFVPATSLLRALLQTSPDFTTAVGHVARNAVMAALESSGY